MRKEINLRRYESYDPKCHIIFSFVEASFMTLWANILEVILEFTMVVIILFLQGNFSISFQSINQITSCKMYIYLI